MNSVNHGGGEDSTSLSLIDRVRQNDPAAWSRLNLLYEPLIRHWCRQQGLGVHESQDVVQEVLVAVNRGIGGFRKDEQRGSFRAWLRTVTYSKTVDFWRSQNRIEWAEGGTDAQRRFGELADSGSEGSAAEDEERQILFRRAVELLKTDFQEKTWMAFWRTVVDGVTAADAAAELELSTNAVHLAKARVLKRLREEFVHLIRE